MFSHGLFDWISINFFNDCFEICGKSSSTDEEPINIFLINELFTVFGIDRTSIENSSLFCNIFTNVGCDPLSNVVMSFLSYICSSNFTSADCPYRFVSNDNIAPLVCLQLVSNCLKLSSTYRISFACFSLFKAFTDANHDHHIILNSYICLFGDILISWSTFSSSLGVASHSPVYIHVFHHVSGDISSKSSFRKFRYGLSHHFEFIFESLVNFIKMDTGWCD